MSKEIKDFPKRVRLTRGPTSFAGDYLTIFDLRPMPTLEEEQDVLASQCSLHPSFL